VPGRLSGTWYLAKYLILPGTWATASLIGKAHLMPALMGGTALRYLVALIMTCLSKLDSLAEPVRVHRENPPARQHARELDWDGPVILSPVAFLLVDLVTPWLQASRVVPFSGRSLMWCAIGHYAVTEPIYYVFHRWLHSPRVYHSSHSHHHASTTTEAISGTSHPLGESLAYLANFSFPFLVPAWFGAFSYELVFIYFVWFDIMNTIGHANFEVIPRVLQWGPLKYFIYTASYHSLHHTKYKYNFCLFCPFWDYLFGTVHPTTDELHRKVLTQPPAKLEVVFLGHGHKSFSMLHLPWLSPYLASHEHRLRWWMVPLTPFTVVWAVFCRYFLSTSVVQRYQYRGTRCATWCLPVTGHFYLMPSHYDAIRKMIVTAARDADAMGVKYLGLAALNKAEWLNHGGSDLLPALADCGIKIVHGNTLTAAAIWQTLQQYTRPEDEVFMTGPTAKIGRVLCLLLAKRGNVVKMMTASKERFEQIRKEAGGDGHRLRRCTTYREGAASGVWVIGKLMKAEEIRQHASVNGLLIDYAVPHIQPHECEGYRYVNGAALRYSMRETDLTFCHDVAETMPACLAAAIIHAREQIPHHECGDIELAEVEKWWQRAKKHGFRLAAADLASTADSAAAAP